MINQQKPVFTKPGQLQLASRRSIALILAVVCLAAAGAVMLIVGDKSSSPIGPSLHGY